jgi:hypothetical protein
MVRAQIGDVMKVTVSNPHRQTIVLTLMTQAAADYATELLNDPENSGWRLEAKRGGGCICPTGASVIDCPTHGLPRPTLETFAVELSEPKPKLATVCARCGDMNCEDHR